MIITDVSKTLSYRDLTIVPAAISRVESRTLVDPFYGCSLPLFTAPMSTVVNEDNYEKWIENHIIPIVPRNIDFGKRCEFLAKDGWVAMSIDEAKMMFIDNNFDGHAKLCIDVANGHMQHLINLCKQIKNRYKHNVTIMTGNIANPLTILDYEYAGIDFVRLSIGSGAGCLTAPQTGVHFPIASLLHSCAQLKRENNLKIKLIADGGIKNYGDVIKALALGADYAMIGSVFASLFESAADCITETNELLKWPIDWNEETKRKMINAHKYEKVFYGMSTKRAQQLISAKPKLMKTSEGVEKRIPCTHTMKQWSENMEAYLRSAMSYCDSFDLEEFIGNQTLVLNSPSEINSVNK